MSLRLLRPACALAFAVLAMAPAVSFAQEKEKEKEKDSAIEKFKAMSEDEVLDAKLKAKEKPRPPFEIYITRIAPFDVLPYVKRNHWSTISVDMQANLADFDGLMQTSETLPSGRPQINLLGMPHAMVYRREVRLQKGQPKPQSMQIMLPEIPKELSLELTRPEALRGEVGWSTVLQKLEPHQMLIPILSPEPSIYGQFWSRIQATLPTSGDREQNPMEVERQRYYRLVLPQPGERPRLSTNPLTWTTISHVVWDGLLPEKLSSAQYSALIDWIHFGGQLIVVSSGPNLAGLQDSVLGPYLPATSSGTNALLTEADLSGMSSAYRPPLWPNEFDELIDTPGIRRDPNANPQRNKPPAAIKPSAREPVYLAGLEPKEGATVIPLGDAQKRTLAVEWRVGRGRVLMIALNPNDKALLNWPGQDTMIRRVLLRRPEENYGTGKDRRVYDFLPGPRLTWVRLLARDFNAKAPPEGDSADPSSPNKLDPVGAWLDTSPESLPVLARESLEKASGITIPGSKFVLKVILGYLIALVPLNWAICKFILRKREWAWIAVPVLALGFAISVERAAAYDMGFDSDVSEIDVLEIQGGHPRGYLSRFASVYSTGRDRYAITYPNDPSALALPLNTGHSLRGEESAMSNFDSTPDPSLNGFQVQPRSLAMFRAEAMVSLPGGITLSGDLKTGKIENGTNLELRDAVLVDTTTGDRIALGTIPASSTVAIGQATSPPLPGKASWTDPEPYLERLASYQPFGPEDRGEIRLVAWADGPHPGQEMKPKVDRHRGIRLVVAHVRYPASPDPAGPEYYQPDQKPNSQ